MSQGAGHFYLGQTVTVFSSGSYLITFPGVLTTLHGSLLLPTVVCLLCTEFCLLCTEF